MSSPPPALLPGCCCPLGRGSSCCSMSSPPPASLPGCCCPLGRGSSCCYGSIDGNELSHGAEKQAYLLRKSLQWKAVSEGDYSTLFAWYENLKKRTQSPFKKEVPFKDGGDPLCEVGGEGATLFHYALLNYKTSKKSPASPSRPSVSPSFSPLASSATGGGNVASSSRQSSAVESSSDPSSLDKTNDFIHIAAWLLEQRPDLLTKSYKIEGGHDKSRYDGENALHMAIAKGDLTLVRWLMERATQSVATAMVNEARSKGQATATVVEQQRELQKKLLNGRAVGEFFSPKGAAYYGELPISFAVSINRKDIVVYLLSSFPTFVHLAMGDKAQGNTPGHMAAYYGHKHMYKILTTFWDDGKGKPGGEKKKTNEEDEGEKKSTEANDGVKKSNGGAPSVVKEVSWADVEMGNLVNRECCTPMVLAAKQGQTEAFLELWETLREPQWTWGDLEGNLYSLDHIDSAPGPSNPERDRIRARNEEEKEQKAKEKEDEKTRNSSAASSPVAAGGLIKERSTSAFDMKLSEHEEGQGIAEGAVTVVSSGDVTVEGAITVVLSGDVAVGIIPSVQGQGRPRRLSIINTVDVMSQPSAAYVTTPNTGVSISSIDGSADASEEADDSAKDSKKQRMHGVKSSRNPAFVPCFIKDSSIPDAKLPAKPAPRIKTAMDVIMEEGLDVYFGIEDTETAQASKKLNRDKDGAQAKKFPLLELVDRKWKKFGCAFFALHFIFDMLVLMCFMAMSVKRTEAPPSRRVFQCDIGSAEGVTFGGEDVISYHSFDCRSTVALEVIVLVVALFRLIRKGLLYLCNPGLWNRIRGATALQQRLGMARDSIIILAFCVQGGGGVAKSFWIWAIASIFAWTQASFYLLALRSSGPFVVVLSRMFTSDVLPIASMIALVYFGFVQCYLELSVNQNLVGATGSELFRYYLATLLQWIVQPQFYMTDTDSLGKGYNLFVGFCYNFLVSIVLVSLLISLFTRTFDSVMQRRLSKWTLERARIMSAIECELPLCLRYVKQLRYWIYLHDSIPVMDLVGRITPEEEEKVQKKQEEEKIIQSYLNKYPRLDIPAEPPLLAK